MTRRDRCYQIGAEAATLNDQQAARAWRILARRGEALGSRDIPKFFDLLAIVKVATVVAHVEGEDRDV